MSYPKDVLTPGARRFGPRERHAMFGPAVLECVHGLARNSFCAAVVGEIQSDNREMARSPRELVMTRADSLAAGGNGVLALGALMDEYRETHPLASRRRSSSTRLPMEWLVDLLLSFYGPTPYLLIFAARFMPGFRAPVFFSAGVLHLP